MKTKSKRKFIPHITVIVHDYCIDEVQGTEDMQYIVENRINDEWGESSNSKILGSLESAYKYAENLHNRFNTKDIIEIFQ